MPRIIIQAGHEGRTTGATGAPGERDFNTDVANKVADKLRAQGFEVKRVNADPKPEEVAGDWDLFLAIHYDADVYNSDGGFVDYPDPPSDGATTRSQAIAKALSGVYFPFTGISNKPTRSNANTRFYYMWKRLSRNTPCVIIECGVGWRKPKDYDVLHGRRELVVDGITNGILKAFNIEEGVSMSTGILAYLGMPSEAEAKSKLKEHLGEKNGKCDWGNADNGGGFLGSERREVKKLKASLEEATIKAAKLRAQRDGLLEDIKELEGKLAEPAPYVKEIVDKLEQIQEILEAPKGETDPTLFADQLAVLETGHDRIYDQMARFVQAIEALPSKKVVEDLRKEIKNLAPATSSTPNNQVPTDGEKLNFIKKLIERFL